MLRRAVRPVRALVVLALVVGALALAACAPPPGKGQIVVHNESGVRTNNVAIARLYDGHQWRVTSEFQIPAGKSQIVAVDPGRYRVGIQNVAGSSLYKECVGVDGANFGVAAGQTITCYVRR